MVRAICDSPTFGECKEIGSRRFYTYEYDLENKKDLKILEMMRCIKDINQDKYSKENEIDNFKEALDAIDCGLLDTSDLDPYIESIRNALGIAMLYCNERK